MSADITTDLIVASSQCTRKAFLLVRGEEAQPTHEYARIINERALAVENAYLESLGEVAAYSPSTFQSRRDAFTGGTLHSGDLRADFSALVRIDDRSKRRHKYEPVIAIGTYKIAKQHKMALTFAAQVLGEAHGIQPRSGKVINAQGRTTTVQLGAFERDLNRAISTLRDVIATPDKTAPPVVLNDHCPLCPFREKCRKTAENEDTLSLLDRMTPKAMQKYQKKGIFTVKQLSYLYKPRRRRKRKSEKPAAFSLELQALAIRTDKTYLQQTPSLRKESVELFLDIEGVPDEDFCYLIGLTTCDEHTNHHQVFWADGKDDEARMFQELFQAVRKYPDAPIYHYGSYEARSIARASKQHGMNDTRVQERLRNLNSFIFGKVYFPTRSNGLKDIGRQLGATWSDARASGIQSLVWRHQWEKGKDARYKTLLVTYNEEDCRALRLLTARIQSLQSQAEDSHSDIEFADAPKQSSTDKGMSVHRTFEAILKSAQDAYKDHRIKLRSPDGCNEQQPRKRGARHGHQAYQRITPSKANRVIRVRRRLRCPRHKGQELERSDAVSEHTLTDLKFTQAGCRKTVVRYRGNKSYCPRCRYDYRPPSIARLNGRFFGHAFQAWAVYQRMVLRLPYRTIAQVSSDLFNERITGSTIIRFVSSLADYYASTERLLHSRILEGPFVHVDETRINIEGTDHYVWTLTDGPHVVFRLTDTREATLIQTILKSYAGVLVSDFFAGYDAVECRQQKCLCHLIRDMNDDLWANPYNDEYETFVVAVRDVLLPILEDNYKYGSKKRHFNKHRRAVDRFYAAHIDGRDYVDETLTKYQKRFRRYRESLFVFLTEDGIPWNNNTAERALRHLAIQRKISGSFFEKTAKQYLRLLGIAQSCRFQEKSFLKFLLSEEKDIDAFRQPKAPRTSKPVGQNRIV